MPPSWVIIADDLTGACDTGASFAGQGWAVRVGLTSAVDWTGADVWACTTESRMMSESQASEAAGQAARGLKIETSSRFYKKIDSTLRGHPGAELAAMMNALGIDRALVCPAFPQQGRVVRNGHVFVHGIPLAESEFVEKVGESDLHDIFSPWFSCQHIGFDDLRQGIVAISGILERPGVTIADAETIDDLKMLAEAGERAGLRLYCGSAGLGLALAADVVKERYSDGRTRQHSLTPNGNIFIIVGSRSKVTQSQVAYLLAQGVRPLWLSEDGKTAPDNSVALGNSVQNAASGQAAFLISAEKMRPVPGEELQIARTLAELAKRAMKKNPAGGLVLTGGDTAAAVCRALDCTAIDLFGEVQPGLGWGVMVDGTQAGLPVVTKAGGFGSSSTLMDALVFLLNLQIPKAS